MEWNLDSAEQMAEQLHWEAMNEPKMPPDPFFSPADSEGREYITPVGEALFFAWCGIVFVLEITACWIGYHILHAKGLL